MQTCATCRFFAPIYTGLDPSPGECRRREPSVLPNHFSAWPRVVPQAWCGEHRPKEAE